MIYCKYTEALVWWVIALFWTANSKTLWSRQKQPCCLLTCTVTSLLSVCFRRACCGQYSFCVFPSPDTLMLSTLKNRCEKAQMLLTGVVLYRHIKLFPEPAIHSYLLCLLKVLIMTQIEHFCTFRVHLGIFFPSEQKCTSTVPSFLRVYALEDSWKLLLSLLD